MRRWILGTAIGAILSLSSLALADGPTREQVLERAKAYAEHTWSMSDKNVQGTCTKKGYKSDYAPGKHVGVPYAWGGFMTLAKFDAHLKSGRGAGSHSRHGILRCVAGVDCSGFVSQVWGLKSKQSTSSLKNVTKKIGLEALAPGDVMNKAGNHVVLWVGRTEAGDPIIYEASGYHSKVRLATPGWKYLNGYQPLRHVGIVESTQAASPPPKSEPVVETKGAKSLVTAKSPSQGSDRVRLRFGKDVGFEPAAEDALALGPDYLAGRDDGTAALYDRVRGRAVLVRRGAAPKSFAVGHADGLTFAGDKLVILDGTAGEIRIYDDAGKRTGRQTLPPQLPVGPALELKDGRVYATTAQGERKIVATMVGGKLLPGQGRPPAFERPRVLRGIGTATVQIGAETLRFPDAEELAWRPIGTWLELEWVLRKPSGDIEVKRVARRKDQVVTLPVGGTGGYVPFSDVSVAKGALVFLEPKASSVDVVWVDPT